MVCSIVFWFFLCMFWVLVSMWDIVVFEIFVNFEILLIVGMVFFV